MRRQDITQHPCYNERAKELYHRSGGFGGTCERCGSLFIDGDVNKGLAGILTWEPVAAPKPFQPNSMERVIYDTMREVGVPMHDGWRYRLAEIIAAKLVK